MEALCEDSLCPYPYSCWPRSAFPLLRRRPRRQRRRANPAAAAPAGNIEAMSCLGAKSCIGVGDYASPVKGVSAFLRTWNGAAWGPIYGAVPGERERLPLEHLVHFREVLRRGRRPDHRGEHRPAGGDVERVRLDADRAARPGQVDQGHRTRQRLVRHRAVLRGDRRVRRDDRAIRRTTTANCPRASSTPGTGRSGRRPTRRHRAARESRRPSWAGCPAGRRPTASRSDPPTSPSSPSRSSPTRPITQWR